MWKVLSVFLIGVVTAGAPAPVPIETPDLKDGETRVLKVSVSYDGKMSREQTRLLNFTPRKAVNRVRWEGEGAERHPVTTRVEYLKNGCVTAHTFVFMSGKNLKLKSIERVTKSPDGEVIERRYFDLAHPVFEYPEVMLHPFILEIAFRSFELKPGKHRCFYLWLDPVNVLKMVTTVKGTEDVELPDGKTVKAYRMEMKPDFSEEFGSFANRLLGPIVPDYTFWLSAEPPHQLVKYVGPLGHVKPIGAPTETHELISYSPGEKTPD